MGTLDLDQPLSGHGAMIMTPLASSTDVDSFRDWLMAFVGGSSVPGELDSKVVFRRPVDLSGLIEIVREVEMFCVQQDRAHCARESIDREDWWERTKALIAGTGEARRWAGWIGWLQDIRVYLERERQHATGRADG